MRYRHFEAFRPVCPACQVHRKTANCLTVLDVFSSTDDDVQAGVLSCPACASDYPIIDGIPFLFSNLAAVLDERSIAVLMRADLHPRIERLIGTEIGPDSWFDALQLNLSTYGYDSWADLDPKEEVASWMPAGAARRCLARLMELGPGPATSVIDVGCAAGRTTFELAAANPGALVLGVDKSLGLLRMASDAKSGQVSYPRRKLGYDYEPRRFGVALKNAGNVDFWAGDALCLPISSKTADLVVAVNVLDCVQSPGAFLDELTRVARQLGRIALATPYDWSTSATPVGLWLTGASRHGSVAPPVESLLRALAVDAVGRSGPGLSLTGEDTSFPWQTRIHERKCVTYRTHLLALKCPHDP